MQRPNYKNIYAMKAEREKRIKKICPNIPYESGIYVFYRTDEANIRRAYCGQAVSLCERCAAHLAEYDHIALSLKKHGFYSEDNPYGWKLMFKTCPKDELDEKEVLSIKHFADNGYQMYNITSGSQSKGKLVTGQYKSPKTYRQGIQAGKLTLARELTDIIGKHLTVTIREDKKFNKVSIKALEKFNALIDEENYK
jgi:hypothetical protein